MEEQDEMLKDSLNRLREIQEERGQFYGDVLHDLGLKGQFTDIHRKYSRLKLLVWEHQHHEWTEEELNKIKEEAEDLANYSIFMMVEVKLLLQEILSEEEGNGNK